MIVAQRPHRNPGRDLPSFKVAAEAVAKPILQAAAEASAQLHKLGIEHALIGGIAVAAHGAPRATSDIDFLVNAKQAFTGTVILSFRPGVPIAVRGYQVDYLTPEGSMHAGLLQRALKRAIVIDDGVPIISLEGLVALKLDAGRRRDMDDIERLLAKSAAADRVYRFLEEKAPELAEQLHDLLGN